MNKGFQMVLLLKRYETAHGRIYHGKDKEKQDRLVALVNANDLEGVETLLKTS